MYINHQHHHQHPKDPTSCTSNPPSPATHRHLHPHPSTSPSQLPPACHIKSSGTSRARVVELSRKSIQGQRLFLVTNATQADHSNACSNQDGPLGQKRYALTPSMLTLWPCVLSSQHYSSTSTHFKVSPNVCFIALTSWSLSTEHPSASSSSLIFFAPKASWMAVLSRS